MRTLTVALLLVLAGCGGGSGSNDPAPAKTTAAAPQSSGKPTVAPPKGTPAPEALSRFRCAKTSTGWNASGYLANTSKAKVTYQVTVYIGEAAGGEEQALTRQVPNVAAGGSVKFGLKNVPAPEDGGPCHVQVLAQP